MVCLKDLKRSLALTLCSVLAFSGIDTTVFAESSNVPEITSNLTVATTFYDLCSGYESWNAHEEESCKYVNSEYGGHFGLEFTDSITVPVDFGSDADLSNYSKDNIDSIVLSLDTDNLQVEYEMETTSSWGSVTQHLQEYLPFGYYRLNKFDSAFLALFDLYVQDAGADVTDKVTIQDLAEEFYSNDKEFSLTFNYSGGTSISTEVHLLLYDYIASHGTSKTSIVDVVRETESKADSKKGVYSERFSTSSSYVISVPTSKTIVDKDFYKSDDNAIVAVKEDDVYNTYYINIDSDKDISLPLDDLTYEDTITKVKLDDTTVYNSSGITLNGGGSLDATKEDMYNNGKSYWITGKVKPLSVFFSPSGKGAGASSSLSSADKIFRENLYTSKFNYNGNEIDLDDIDLSSTDLKDFIENSIVHYAKYNKRLDNGEKFNDGNEYSSYIFKHTGEVPLAVKTEIFFKEPVSFSGIGTNADENEHLDKTISGLYSDDDYDEGSRLTSDYKDDPIKSFYTHKDLPSEYEDKFDKESTEEYSFDFDKLNYGIPSDYGYFIFLRLPKGDETREFSNAMHKNSYYYGDDVRVYIESRGCYYYPASNSEGRITDNYIEDSNGDSYAYIKVHNSNHKWLVTEINKYYSTNYSSIDELLLDFGTPMYSFTIPNGTSGLNTNTDSTKVTDYKVGSTDTIVFISSVGVNHFFDEVNSDLKTGYLQDNGYISPIYKYTAKSVRDFITLKDLDLSADSCYAGHVYKTYSKYYYYKFSYYNAGTAWKLSTLDKCYAKSISFSLDDASDHMGLYSPEYMGSDMSVYSKFVDKFLGMLGDLADKIDYDKSYTPDFLSGGVALEDLFDVSVYDTTSILYSDYTSAKDYDLDVGLGTYATSVDSISTGNNRVSIAKCSDTNLVIPNSFFNASSVGTSIKGKDMSVYMQIRSDMPIGEVKNAVLANKAEIYKKDSYTGVDKLIENSDVLTPPEGYYNFFNTYLGSYVDYKFGNIIFASKPSAPLDLTLEGDKLTWVKPIDEGLGYTVNTRSSKMSIRSISPNFTSKTDDVIHLESYKLDIKDSSDNVVHTQTLTDTGSGLVEEITIPATYLSSDYTAYVYATNKIGVSDSATINLEAPNGSVEVVTERDSYKVGDTITYTETITNSGSVDLNNVKVTQSLTGGTYEAQAGVSLTDNVATITSLPVGSSMELKYKYVVPNSVNVGDTISNKVSITSDEGISKDVTKSVTVVGLKGSVDVVTERDTYKVGDTITYTETITNSGTIDLTNVKVTQSLTGGTYNTVTGVTTTDNIATIPALNQGDSVTLTYKYVIPEGVNVGDIISNTVSITSDEGLNISTTKDVTVVDSIKDLDLDVTTDKSSYKPGDTVILKSSVKNTGEVDLTNVKITQQLDGEYIPKSGVTMTGKDAIIPTLAVGETVEVEYKIVIPSNYNQTSISNKTDVTADGGVSKNVVKTITVVLPKPTKEPAPAPVVTKAPTPVPTKAPTQEPTKAPTAEPTKAPTAEPTKAPTPVPEYDFTIKDVYHNDDGTTEVKERENVRIKEGEHYSFSALDSDDYIPRVPKYEGIASKDTEIIFDYDEKEKRVTLQGYVTYSDGSPIKDKLIEISGKENKSGITDSTGFYRIENILVGDYNYTLYNDVTTGSGILAKCDIKVIKKNGIVEVKYTDDDCKVDYTTEDGVIRVNANIKKEEVATPSPTPTAEPTLAPTQEPTLAPTQEPTVAPTVEPTVEPTVKPTKKPTPVSTQKPTSTPKPTKKPVVPIKVSTPEPTRKPTRVVYLAQTGIYDIKKVVSAGVLIISGLGLVIIALRRRKK